VSSVAENEVGVDDDLGAQRVSSDAQPNHPSTYGEKETGVVH
jgi:hypothetical protein